MRRLLRLLLLLPIAGCSFMGHQLRHLTGSSEAQLADDVIIERDEWGVPTVHGRSQHAALFGLAYAMAEDAHARIEEDYIHALGWAAHYYGERFLTDDLVRAALRIEQRARADYAALPPESQRRWAAFAGGLNYYHERHPHAPRKLIAHYEPWMIYARAQVVPNDPQLAAIAALAGEPHAGSLEAIPVPMPTRFALLPADTGPARLLAAVTGPFFGPGLLYEARLATSDGWHFAGVVELGLPRFRAGHNNAIAWALGDAATPLRVQRVVAPAGITETQDTLNVNTMEGVVRRTYAFRRTTEGAVFAMQGDTVVVVDLADYQRPDRLWPLLHATSLEAFRTALPAGQPAVYGDTSGVLEALNGAEPISAVARDPVAMLLDVAVRDVRAEIAAVVDEWERVGGTNPQRAFVLDTIIEQLRVWAGEPRPDVSAASVFQYWQEELQQPGYEQGFGRFRALENAVTRMRSQLGDTNQPLSELNRLQRRTPFSDAAVSLPLEVAAHLEPGSGVRRYAVSGVAWLGRFELRAPPALASIVPFGQSADSASGHYFDQAPRYVNRQLKLPGAVVERYHPGRRGETVTSQRP